MEIVIIYWHFHIFPFSTDMICCNSWTLKTWLIVSKLTPSPGLWVWVVLCQEGRQLHESVHLQTCTEEDGWALGKKKAVKFVGSGIAQVWINLELHFCIWLVWCCWNSQVHAHGSIFGFISKRSILETSPPRSEWLGVWTTSSAAEEKKIPIAQQAEITGGICTAQSIASPPEPPVIWVCQKWGKHEHLMVDHNLLTYSIPWFHLLVWYLVGRYPPFWEKTIVVGNPVVWGIPQFGETHTDDVLFVLSGLTKEQIEQFRKGFKVHVVQLICIFFFGSWSFFVGEWMPIKAPKKEQIVLRRSGASKGCTALVHLSSRKRQLELELSRRICSVNRSPRWFWAGLLLDNFHVGNSVHGRFQLQPRSNWSAYQQPKAWIWYWQPEPCGYESGRDSIQEFETVPHAGPVWKEGVDSSFIGTALVSHTSLRRNFWCLAKKHIRP